MRLAIVSDIHSNLVALDAVLAAIGSVDGVRVLGDIVGYGPEPDGVVQRLAGIGATGVSGNHDQVAVGRLGAELFNRDARTAIEWTRDRISATTRAWLGGLPDRVGEGLFTLVHGSPRDPTWEYILDERTALENLAAFDTPHCLFGHTHLPAAFRATPGGMAVGIPADGDRVVLDDRRTITWHRTAYDIAATQRAMRGLGLPERLAARLAVGR